MKAIRTIDKSLLACLAWFLLAASLTWAQSLEEDPAYQELLAKQEQAQAALVEGDYDKAYQISQEGNATSSLFYERFRAKKALKEASEKLNAVKAYKGDKSYPDLYQQAMADYKDANTAYHKHQYPKTNE
jgi:hypothetical protein